MIFTLEFFIWICIFQVRIKNIPYFNAVKKNWWLKNLQFCRLFLQDVLSWWSSVVAPVIGKIYVVCQVGWRKAVYYFVGKKSNFRYHLLAESDSRPSSAYILSLLVSRIAPVIGKHALYCTFSNFDSKFTLPDLSYIIFA